MAVGPSGNPYDFRSPVRRRRLLAGRAAELGEIDRLLRGVAIGRPAHLSLFGPPGSGKSSLLNSVAEIAAERQLLAVRLELREAIVDTELAFYGAAFEAALDALINIGALNRDADLIRSWNRQIHLGEVDAPPMEQPLEIGMLLAAKAGGRMVGEVSGPMLQRDLDRIVEFGAARNVRGVVLCIDRAEYLDDNSDLAPSLLDLATAASTLTIVTAAEKAGTLQAAAPRAWAQIEVKPFASVPAVFDAITRPLQDVEERAFAPTAETAADVYKLTGGQPYEVNLVCHFIWEAITEGEQSDFALSPSVIQRVLHELEEKGRHEATPEIPTFAALAKADLESVAALAPFENLTMRQIALVRLMFDDYDEAELEETSAGVEDELLKLVDRSVVRVERDRFEICGGPDARLYLKYAVQRHTDRKIRFDDTYARRATFRCTALLGTELAGEGYRDALLSLRGRPYEMGGSEAGNWLNELADAAGQGDLLPLSPLLGFRFRPEDMSALRSHGAILFGLVLQVGLHEVEHAEFVVNLQDRSAEDAPTVVAEWVANHETLIEKYDVRVLDSRCEVLSPEFATAAASYAQLSEVCRMAFFLYLGGLIGEAAKALSGTLELVENSLGDGPADPLVRGQLAEGFSRAGFIKATEGQWRDALTLIARSEALSLEESWLLAFNASYVHAQQGEYEEAARLAQLASDRFVEQDGYTVLLAAFPTPETWAAPGHSSNVMELRGGWVQRFVGLQTAVLSAQADPEGLEAVRAELDGLAPNAPPELLRLAAWAELTLLSRKERAVELFDRAVDASSLEGVDMVRMEAEFANEYDVGSIDTEPGTADPPA